jgi:DNA-directed RNA polymerase subunit RPC12/RpoP
MCSRPVDIVRTIVDPDMVAVCPACGKEWWEEPVGRYLVCKCGHKWEPGDFQRGYLFASWRAARMIGHTLSTMFQPASTRE